jgi:hypothetical protein
MSKKEHKAINEKSTRETFDRWLQECGNDLFDYGGILSCAGSDGPDIHKNDLDGIPFNVPEAIDQYLFEDGYYEHQKVIMGEVDYNPPTTHYIDWFNENIK